MTTDVIRTAASKPRLAAAGPTPGTRPPELAQLVWRRALALVEPGAAHDHLEVAHDLLQVARHNSTVMAHAFTLGRTHLRAHSDDGRARAAAKILQAAITFLGVKPRRNEIAPSTDLTRPLPLGVGN